jgi:hypothetical protein
MEESPHEYNPAKLPGLPYRRVKYLDLLFHFFPACPSYWTDACADEKFAFCLVECTFQYFYRGYAQHSNHHSDISRLLRNRGNPGEL